MAEKFLLKDHLFNVRTVGQLAAEFAGALSGFDADAFASEVLAGFAERELLQRLDWIADCLEPRLAADFQTMADQLEAAMPPPLDPTLRDDDFGQFIHAVPGILAVRHGSTEAHRHRALDLLHAATKRFSMEFYIRPFLNTWPDDTLAQLQGWAEDRNYHVRRLVSEGTRPKLPWAKAVKLTPDQTLPLLDMLYADSTRFVTRSVSNHLNDISKSHPELVLNRLADWRKTAQQGDKELAWMTRHSLRTLIKQGHPGAMRALGYRDNLELRGSVTIDGPARIGESLRFSGRIECDEDAPVLVDYVLWTARADGALASKVFKLKTGKVRPDAPFDVEKSHRLKADATTFTLRPGPARLELQVNGRVVASVDFDLLAG